MTMMMMNSASHPDYRCLWWPLLAAVMPQLPLRQLATCYLPDSGAGVWLFLSPAGLFALWFFRPLFLADLPPGAPGGEQAKGANRQRGEKAIIRGAQDYGIFYVKYSQMSMCDVMIVFVVLWCFICT